MQAVPAASIAFPKILWHNTSRIDAQAARAMYHTVATSGDLNVSPPVSLSEAVTEVIWSEVLKHALPFSSVPVYAVVRPQDDARYSVLRQASLCLPDYRDDAVSEIHAEFTAIFGDDIRHLRDGERISKGLAHVLRRYGVQFAASVARRLPSGMVAPARLALDGRLTATGAMPLGAHATSAAEIRPVVRGLRQLYQRVQRQWADEKLVSRPALFGAFWRAYRRDSAVQLLKMTGIPAAFWAKQEAAGRTRFYRQLRKIDVSLRHAALAAASVADNADLEHCLRGLLSDDASRWAVIKSYIAYRDRFIATLPAERKPYGRLFLALQAHRLNADWAASLSSWCRFDGAPEQMAAHISQAVGHVRDLVQDLHPNLPAPTALGQIVELMYLESPLREFVSDCMQRSGAGSSAMERIAALVEACGRYRPSVPC